MSEPRWTPRSDEELMAQTGIQKNSYFSTRDDIEKAEKKILGNRREKKKEEDEE